VACNWDGVDYKQFTIKIIGDATMWDTGKKSVLTAKFTDAPILSLHKGKGCEIAGINFQGGGIGRDSRFSPQAGICIAPFRYNAPPDGGYPTLQEYYRGSESRGGSTRVLIDNCTTNNTTVGIIISPSGHVQNGEMVMIQNHRFQNHKFGFAGCQAQEKANTLYNIGAWGKVDTLFVWNRYGQATPGHYVIDLVNIAGNVKTLLSRESAGYFPLFVSNVYAESLKEIGYWNTQLCDKFENSSINFGSNFYPSTHLSGGGVTLQNNSIRYYGRKERTFVFMHMEPFKEINNDYENDVLRIHKHLKNPDVTITTEQPAEGKTVVFYEPANYTFLGSGVQAGTLQTDFDLTIPHKKGIYKK